MEKRLELAKQFALSVAHNIRENLKYYARHNASDLLQCAIQEITVMIQEEK